MKKIILISMMIFTVITYSQKKKNGVIYDNHPGIIVVESMLDAFVEGDADKVGGYLAEDFQYFNGSNTNKDAKRGDKESFLKEVEFWNENIDYLSITRTEGAYPDALEYKKSGIWIQTWEHVKGVHKKTGVKLDMPFHRLFVINEDNEIRTMISYYDERIYAEIGRSLSTRENGVIYNNHEYINKVRRLVHAFENGDDELGYSFFDKNAKFRNINMPIGETISLEESKENDIKFKEKFEISSIDVVGYPDYLNYDMDDSSVVQSWWNVRLIRKSDKKKIAVPLMLIHNFNDDGMITRELAYFSSKMLE